MEVRRAAVIARLRSRRGAEALWRIPAMLAERGIDVVETCGVETRKQLRKAIKRARRRSGLIVVCGGDGTLTSAVALFAHRDVTLGVVPSGTVNSFSRNLGIDQTFEGAADTIAHGVERRVDLGRVNGTYFANFLTVGIEADVARKTTRPLKKVLGPLAYGAAALGPFLSHRPFRCALRWGKRRLRLQTHHVIVANGRYYGYRPIDENAAQAGGKLTVFVRDERGRLGLLFTYAALALGKQRSIDGARLWSTFDSVKIRTDPVQRFAVDGHVLGKTPISIRAVPAALRVMTASGALDRT
ncbi:MAG TPA: YegS/Rv2252/BmrU family lipid kinase [Candidatus Baltobacteraceae bacterium]|jgi:YegS/Rv2252/BmrU family lipid kinase